MATKKEIEKLKTAYTRAVMDYVQKFLDMYDFSDLDFFWVADEIGGVANIADYFFRFDDMKFAVDNGLDWGELVEWYDYTADTYGLIPSPNLKSWHAGCPRLSADEVSKMVEAHNAVESLKRKVRLEAMEMVNGVGRSAN